MRVPIYIEATAGEPAEAYFRKGLVSTPLRLAPELEGALLDLPIDGVDNAEVAALDPRAAEAVAAVSRACAALPSAAVRATIARIGAAVEAVERAGLAHAPIDAVLAPDAPAFAGLAADLARQAPPPNDANAKLADAFARDAAALAALAPDAAASAKARPLR
jgi:hypothetical protein